VGFVLVSVGGEGGGEVDAEGGFVPDDDRTELPIESANGVKLLVQKCDDRAVDAPGGIEELAQVAGGILALLGTRLRRCEESGDGFVEEVFEQSRGGWSERAEGSAAGESLEVAQAQRAGFPIVAGEGLGVLHKLFVGHAALPDALLKQGPWWSVGHVCSPPGLGGSGAL
jgi:hypothetical protein